MSFSAYRDIKQKSEKRFDQKQDKQAQFRAVVVDENGLQSGSGSIWASQNKRRVWVMPIGGVQPFQVVCVRITPVIGLGVIVGYADPLSRTLEVLRTDYEFYLETNQVVTAYESPSNEDFLPGGRMQLWLASKMLQPLAIAPQSTGLIVNVVKGYYLYDNQRVLYGGAINVSLVQNPNAGEHYYAGLYLDAANTLQVVYGASVVLATTPPEPTWPDGAFQLGVVRINDTQTRIVLSQDTDPLNDVLDRRILWADVDSFGAWPFAHILTVSPTDPSADYTTIGAAITAASAGDVILVDAATYNEAVAINKVLTLIGLGVGSTIITNVGAATITITAANVTLRFLTVNNTSAGATGDCVLLSTSASDVVIDQCTIEKISGAATLATAVHVASGTNHVILNSKLRCTTGTSRYGLLADTGSNSTTMINGRCQGSTKDVRTNDASAAIVLQDVILASATATSPSYEEAAGAIGGTYYLTSGNLAYIDNSGVVGPVWLEDTSARIRKFFPDLVTALATAGTGDSIYLEAGTYTLASGATISTNGLTIYAVSPGSVTITNATASSQTFNVTGADVTFRNLTITQTGTGGGPTSVVAFEGDNFTLDNCVLTKTGAATLSAGLYQYGGTGAKVSNSFITTSGGTTNYGYYNTIATGAIEFWGGKISGTQQDIFGDDSGSTITLYDTILANSLVSYSGTKKGHFVDASGNVLMFGTSDIKGFATNVPDIGTTTLAEKFGNIYLGASKDAFASDDSYALFNRQVNWGFTPDEHWKQNTDELSWSGWAGYTGFATPSIISTTNSIYRVANAGATKAFRYRAAATGDHIYLRCRVAITYIVSAGLMVDDGANNADGNGANNFYRVYLTQSAVGGAITAVEQYRNGGGAVTTNASTFTFPPHLFAGLALNTSGTRWTSWGAFPSVFGESGELIQFTTGSTGKTWTPARVGLYWVGTASDGGRKGLWDWYDEAVS